MATISTEGGTVNTTSNAAPAKDKTLRQDAPVEKSSI